MTLRLKRRIKQEFADGKGRVMYYYDRGYYARFYGKVIIRLAVLIFIIIATLYVDGDGSAGETYRMVTPIVVPSTP